MRKMNRRISSLTLAFIMVVSLLWAVPMGVEAEDSLASKVTVTVNDCPNEYQDPVSGKKIYYINGSVDTEVIFTAESGYSICKEQDGVYGSEIKYGEFYGQYNDDDIYIREETSTEPGTPISKEDIINASTTIKDILRDQTGPHDVTVISAKVKYTSDGEAEEIGAFESGANIRAGYSLTVRFRIKDGSENHLFYNPGDGYSIIMPKYKSKVNNATVAEDKRELSSEEYALEETVEFLVDESQTLTCSYKTFDMAGNSNNGFYIHLEYGKKPQDITLTGYKEKYTIGETINITGSSTTGKDVVIRYKEKGSDDSTYTGEVPTAVGEYTLEAKVAGDSEYEEKIITKDFEIEKKPLEITCDTIPTIYQGQTYDLRDYVHASGTGVTYTTSHYTITYKAAGESIFSSTQPTVAGTHNFKVDVAANGPYAAATSGEYSYTISELPLDACNKVDGTNYLSVEGNPAYVKDCITVKPNTGYKIRKGDSGEFSESLTLTKDELYSGDTYSPNVKIALQRGDGAYTMAQELNSLVDGLDSIVFDSEKPVITKSFIDDVEKSIDNNASFRAGKVEVQYEDDNIDKVIATIDGAETTYTQEHDDDTSIAVTIDSEFGKPKQVALVAKDKAGNESAKLQFTLNAPLKTLTGTISVGDAGIVCVDDSWAPSITIEDYNETIDDSASDFYSYYDKDGNAISKPNMEGTYTVSATIPAHGDYADIVCSGEFNIKLNERPSDTGVTVADVEYGGEINPVVTCVDLSEVESSIDYKYTLSSEENYSGTTPSKPGTYKLKVTIPKTSKYNETICYDTFTIGKFKNGTAEITVPNTFVGTPYEPVLAVHVDSGVEYESVIEYKAENATSYTTTKPQDAGKYKVRATISGEDMETISCEDSFTISKMVSKNTSLSVTDVYVGASYDPVFSTDSDGKVVFEYKVTTDADASYSKIKPEKAGDYTVRATVPETKKYEKVVREATFSIKKKTATATVKLSDQYVGVKYEPVLSTDSDGKDKATFSYRKAGEDESAYTSEKPVEAGKYVLKVDVPETDKYNAVSVEKEFEIKYLSDTKASYTISGTQGKNGYYVTDVYLKAPRGYEISTSRNGKYTEDILYTDDITTVYIRRSSDGAQLESVEVTEKIQIDKDSPTIANAYTDAGVSVFVSDGRTIYADKLTLLFNDDNLSVVKIVCDDGTTNEINATDGKVLASLDSKDDIKQFSLTAEDKAGHEHFVTLVLCAAWMENNIVPAGRLLPLKISKSYGLEGGSWKVAGDSTVYIGNREFYVATSGDYMFEKK
ncbi:MAG: hypothetical protein E7271_09235 [Lachnospiraceae bacterium]|nr:hypothetical protein [Lachnospiraceae bacterium]